MHMDKDKGWMAGGEVVFPPNYVIQLSVIYSYHAFLRNMFVSNID